MPFGPYALDDAGPGPSTARPDDRAPRAVVVGARRGLTGLLLAALAGVGPQATAAPTLQTLTAQAPGAAPVDLEATLEFPSGPLRDAFAALGKDVEAALPLEGFASVTNAGRRVAPGLAEGALGRGATWTQWRTALLAARARSDDARARATLALVALEQGRYRDANAHLARAAAEPALLASLLPRFVPGVPAGTLLARGARPPKLADGAVLRPALPPVPIVEGERRAVRASGIELGATRFDLLLSVEHEGVQAELKHLSGPAARVAIVLPRVEDYGVGAEYVDWDKQATIGAPLAVELRPGEEPHVLFARFEPKDPAWPTRLPDELPASVAERGVWLVLGERDPERDAYASIARELTLRELGIECGIAAAGSAPPGGAVVDLARPETRAEKLAWLVSALERFVLRGR
ncbi:MAG: hypothetical protein IPJ77_11950 [Planctomycetes bacterium]|nr:hypothetical protein [Planctomycetota bacterium]